MQMVRVTAIRKAAIHFAIPKANLREGLQKNLQVAETYISVILVHFSNNFHNERTSSKRHCVKLKAVISQKSDQSASKL